MSTETNETTRTEEVPFETFSRIDLRVGTVLTAEKVPEADKLLKLTVNFGGAGERTVVAGLAKAFPAESLVGRQVLGVVNLPPRKLKGITSTAMLLACEGSEGRLELPSCPGAPNGAKLG